MSRIRDKFVELANMGRKGFIPFVTAGDPDVSISREIVFALIESGADIIELGVPFSDPMADGPTIQASSQRALTNDVSVSTVLDLVRQIRERSEVPIVLFSYLNPLFRYGIERLAKDASEAGVDGVLITDVVDDEANQIAAFLGRSGLDLISLVAPTTSDERMAKILPNASGFIYAVSHAGVTGAQKETSSSAEDLVRRARRFTDLPIAVGFGISTSAQIAEVWKYAEAAVVGSAIVAEIERSIPKGTVVENVRTFVAGLYPQVAKTGSEI